MDKKIIKKVFILIFSLVATIIALKLAVFYMPFLVAFSLYLLIEPGIRFFMNKFKLKRKTSSIIILTISISIIIGLIAWGIATIISEASNLLKNLNEYINIIYEFIQSKISKIDLNKLQVSEELKTIFDNSTQDILQKISDAVYEIDKQTPEKNYLQLYYLRYEQGLTQREIAENLNLSQSEVSKRLFKLMSEVKQALV